ncbi:hypothetical protein TBLA_0A05230 [Henningerozyma blattae CBS 6284]|uniref:Vta1 C-terminal domain-containing protein n=1 Tax=Henningerozyma blattae (strain ATCC 34711 / CBS 6284 / DSM 70876 / NBRC 10599 / NRRL Y-10934 / UCD 77-7) TaxID=1071380 RepID=I2GW14_HENB6|nr:hypothetical protein TBLA_0A05230 [Tetrapisispora blattae CBS 6284]CCH58316.1 hypothetical protein TBLA_0A05230 [Tetrapisispora blattae CBS 6284]
MVLAPSVQRVINRAIEFDNANLPIISYYLRLYSIEQILRLSDRGDEENIKCGELLDTIETFKKEINDTEHDNEGLTILVNDQSKARIYLINFTISLYNKLLGQIKEGPWDNDLKNGLWCSIDLFNSIMHLWQKDLNEETEGALKKRTKICKLYISKLAKGELGAPSKSDEIETKSVTATIKENSMDKDQNLADMDKETPEINQNNDEASIENLKFNGNADISDQSDQSDNDADVNEEQDENESEPPTFLPDTPSFDPTEAKLDHENDSDIKDGPNEFNFKEHISGISNDENDESVDSEAISHTDISLPVAPSSVPTFIDENADDIDDEALRKLREQALRVTQNDSDSSSDDVDEVSDDNDETNISSRNDTKKEEELVHPVLTKEDMEHMMDRASKIERVQRLAKYVVSALNYEDIPTAKDELKRALAILDAL